MRRPTDHVGLSKLDKELFDRLDATLDAQTKFELEAMDVLAELASPDEGRSPTADAATSGRKREYATNPGNEDAAAPATEDDSGRRVTLAKVVFEDGDAFHFAAVPSDGEIGVSYIGSNSRRWLAATNDLPSPLRLFVSIAPPDAPLPWILAAVDKQKDRLGLIGERRLCDRVDEPLDAVSNRLRLRVPGLPGLPDDRDPPSGGEWTPDDVEIFTVGGFCGWNGEQEFRNEMCSLEFFPEYVTKCTPELNFELTHNSIRGGNWKRRKSATAVAAACGSPVRIRHQYRKLGFFQWNWVTANDDVVGPAEITGSLWLGLIRRRRRINYQRAGGFGGFRAWSLFGPHLAAGPFD